MKMIYKFRLKERSLLISCTVLFVVLYGTWFFESYFAEVMFFMDYNAEDLVSNAKDIMLQSILTWERYIDSSMRYLINFFPIFAVFPALPFLRERKSYYVLGAHRFQHYQKNILKSILIYAGKGGLTIALTFSFFFLAGSLFLQPSVSNIGGFSSIFPDNFYIQHPCLFFLFMSWTIYLAIGISFGLMACGISLICDNEIYVLIIPLLIYPGESYFGYLLDFLPFKISESVCAFNTLYSTGKIFIPVITIFIFDFILIIIGLKKRRMLIDG